MLGYDAGFEAGILKVNRRLPYTLTNWMTDIRFWTYGKPVLVLSWVWQSKRDCT
jgi:hypothetical protein